MANLITDFSKKSGQNTRPFLLAMPGRNQKIQVIALPGVRDPEAVLEFLRNVKILESKTIMTNPPTISAATVRDEIRSSGKFSGDVDKLTNGGLSMLKAMQSD